MQLGPLGLNTIVNTGTHALRAAGRVAGDFGARLKEGLRAPASASPATGSPANAVRALEAGIRGVLAAEGVVPTGPVTIGRDDLGRLHVVGDHPNRARINEALALHPELGDVFGEVAIDVHRAQSSGIATPGLPAAYERDGRVTLDVVVRPLATGLDQLRAA